jgi:hypothetical protein
MKIGDTSGLLIAIVITAVVAFALMLTGIWYTVIIAGLVASLLVRRGYVVSVISSILGGIIAVLLVFLTIPSGYLGPVLSEVAAISGIGSAVLLALMILVTAALALSGSLVGTFIAKNTAINRGRN